MYYSAIESEIIAGIEEECRASGYRLRIMNLAHFPYYYRVTVTPTLTKRKSA